MAENYSYTYSSGGALSVGGALSALSAGGALSALSALDGGYTVTEYSSSSSSGLNSDNLVSASSGLLSGSGAALLGDASGYSQSGLVYVSSSSGSAGSAGASFGGSASAGGNSNAVVNQVTQDLLALGGAASQSTGYSFGASSQSSGYGFGASSGGALESSAFSRIEQAILSASNPIDINETEVITVNGESGIWSNKQEVINWRGVIPITQYVINQDSSPEVIHKRTAQQLVYDQEIAVRYLRPPTPPPPGEILIRQEKNIVTPPAPPLVIRQQPPRPETPPPMVVREAPPRPPAAVGQKVITISGKRLPPAPRKVVIERLAPLPSKPQSVIIERWLPYRDNKRRVIFTKPSEPDPVIPRPRNVIVQWEAPQVVIKKEFRDLGVIRANPVEYVQRYGATLKSHVELPQFVKEIRPPTGVVLAAEHVSASFHELEGDVQALGLIDLDREGLSEYRSYLSRFLSSGSASFGASGSLGGSASFGASGNLGGSGYAVSYSGSSLSASGSASASANLNAVIAELFASVDKNASGRISLSEAESLLLKLNSRLGRRYGEDEVKLFFRALDVNSDGQIDFEEFRRALLRQF